MTNSADVCEMCREVMLMGIAVTGGSGKQDTSEPFSRLVLRTAIVDVLSGLGSLAPGYALVVPRQHVASTGELSHSERVHAYHVAHLVARRVEQTFGCRIVIVEHGSSGHADAQSGGGCITHCHIHLFPVAHDTDFRAFLPPACKAINSFDPLVETAGRRENYYFCSWFPEGGFFASSPRLESQFARRIWARSLGYPDKWDWALFPSLENCRVTVDALRPDGARTLGCGGGSLMSETLETYRAHADDYAAQTRSFPVRSTLPDELQHLTEDASGPILDAGAGAGRDANFIAGLGREVIALDACDTVLTSLPWEHDFPRVVGDVRSLPIAERSIGAIWCSAVLLHLDRDDFLRALREFQRVLVPGGLMQISVKEGRGVLSEPISARAPQAMRHFFLYDFDDIASLAGAASLEIVEKWNEDEGGDAKTLQRWAKALLRKAW